MKKRVVILICGLLTVFMSLFAACQTKKEEDEENEYAVNYTVHYAYNFNWVEDKNYPQISKLCNYNDYRTFCRDNRVITATYAEEFFVNSFVVGVELSTSNGAQSYEVNRVEYQDNKLTIFVSRVPIPDDVSGAAVMGEYIICVGLDNDYSAAEEIVLNNAK